MAYMSLTDLKRNALNVIGFMETSQAYPAYYQKVAANFDGAGMSYGVFQWNFGQGTLQPIFQELIDDHEDILQSIMGTDYTEFNTMVTTYTTEQQINWADGYTVYDGGTPTSEMEQPWLGYFEDLGATEACQDAQTTASVTYFNGADNIFNTYTTATPATYGSQRFYTLALDQSVNSGTSSPVSADEAIILAEFAKINTISKTEEEIELEKMRIFARHCAGNKNQEFFTLITARRRVIAEGEGWVNGVYKNIYEDFGLGMDEAKPSSAPAEKPRLARNTNEDSDFDSTPSVRGNMLHPERINKISTTVDRPWTFNEGIKQRSTYMVKTGNDDNYVGYTRIARIRSSETETSSYGRMLLRGELIHSSSSYKMGTLEMYLADDTSGGISVSSKFNVINTGLLGYQFGAGDVFYQQLDPTSGTRLFVDIWVRTLNYSQVSFNITGLICDNGMDIEVEPIEQFNLQKLLPASTGFTGSLETGKINESTGVEEVDASWVRSVNTFDVSYYGGMYRYTSTVSASVHCYFYDEDDVYLGYKTIGTDDVAVDNQIFSFWDTARKFRLAIQSTDTGQTVTCDAHPFVTYNRKYENYSSRVECEVIDPVEFSYVTESIPTIQSDVSTLQANADDYKYRNVVSISASTTLSTTYNMIRVDASSAPVTVTLPTASGNSGFDIIVKKIDSSSNAVIIDGNGTEVIDGSTTKTLSDQYDSAHLVAHNATTSWMGC